MGEPLERWPWAANLFSPLPPEEKEKITLVEQAARQTLIEKDSFAPPDRFLVVKGVCELYSAFSLAGDNDLGYRICANQFIGLSEIVSPVPMKRTAAVVAKTPLCALRIRGEDFLRWSQVCLPVYNAVIFESLEQKHRLQTLYRNCSVTDSVLAGAYYLDYLYGVYLGCYPEGYQGPVRLWETQSEIAQSIRRDPRSVARIIQKLREAGCVGVERGKVVITPAQRKTLRRFIEERSL